MTYADYADRYGLIIDYTYWIATEFIYILQKKIEESSILNFEMSFLHPTPPRTCTLWLLIFSRGLMAKEESRAIMLPICRAVRPAAAPFLRTIVQA